MDSLAINFNPLATQSNGTCVYDTTAVYGCMNPLAKNYNPFATVDNYHCIFDTIIAGCLDTLALNYNPLATVSGEECIYSQKVWGCKDTSALNFNPLATHSDGYCIYSTIIRGCTDVNANNFNPYANTESGDCEFDSVLIYGCTNSYALNYNPYAQIENGSCIYIMVSDTVTGCRDVNALNYNPLATKDGSCIFTATEEISGCTSPMALNYNANATQEDGSCVFARPINLVQTIIDTQQTAINDTIGKVVPQSCSFQFDLPIESVSILNTINLGNGNYEVEWGIIQSGNITTNVKVVYNIQESGNNLLYLSLVCNSSASGLKGKPISLVNGVTVSAVLNSELQTLLPESNPIEVIDIFPVPVEDQLNVKFDSHRVDNIELFIYSVAGLLEVKMDVTTTVGDNQLIINTSALNSGFYILKIKQGNEIVKHIKFSK